MLAAHEARANLHQEMTYGCNIKYQNKNEIHLFLIVYNYLASAKLLKGTLLSNLHPTTIFQITRDHGGSIRCQVKGQRRYAGKDKS